MQLVLAGIAIGMFLLMPAHDAEFSYSETTETTVLQYSRYTVMPYYDGGAYKLTVYGDGRVVAFIHEDFSTKKLKSLGFTQIVRRGEFETRMTPRQIAEVLASFEPLFLLDEASLKAEKKAKPVNGTSTDGGEVVFSFDLEEYSTAEGSQGAVRNTISWPSLYRDSRLYPDIQGIQDLSRVNVEARKWVFTIAQEVSIAELEQ